MIPPLLNPLPLPSSARFTALSFASAGTICAFLREVHLQRFLLLGKKSVLIAALSHAELRRATQQYGAAVIRDKDVVQTARLYVSLHREQ